MLKKILSIVGLFLTILLIASPVQAGSIKKDPPMLSSGINETCAAPGMGIGIVGMRPSISSDCLVVKKIGLYFKDGVWLHVYGSILDQDETNLVLTLLEAGWLEKLRETKSPLVSSTCRLDVSSGVSYAIATCIFQNKGLETEVKESLFGSLYSLKTEEYISLLPSILDGVIRKTASIHSRFLLKGKGQQKK